MADIPLLRILCLHGYTQNGNILRKKMGALRKSLKNVAEMDYVDAPFLMPVPTEGPPELLAKIQAQRETEDEKPYAWYFRRENGTCEGLEEALDHMFKVLKDQGPYDMIYGFSQGASVAALAAIALKEEVGHPLRRGSEHPPLKAVISTSGFRFEDVVTKPYYTGMSACPSLHILGALDTLIDPERSHALAALFLNAETYIHKGGHVIPSDSAARRTTLAFVEKIKKGEWQGRVEEASGDVSQ